MQEVLSTLLSVGARKTVRKEIKERKEGGEGGREKGRKEIRKEGEAGRLTVSFKNLYTRLIYLVVSWPHVVIL